MLNKQFPRIILGSSNIKRRPFQATYEAILQEKSNQNRVVEKQIHELFRDSHSRFRRTYYFNETTYIRRLEPDIIFISDAINGKQYSLTTSNKTGVIIDANYLLEESYYESDEFEFDALKNLQVNQIITQTDTQKKLFIGEQILEKILCVGIKILNYKNNEQHCLNNEHEIWFSQDLMEIVEHNIIDDNFIESYKLTNIYLSEPQQSLFKVPENYIMTNFVSSCELI